MTIVLKVIKFLIPVAILLAIIFFRLSEPTLSNDQKDVIELYGYPSQFVITYLPRGDADNPQLVRSETWYFPGFEKSISFLGGSYYSEDNYNFEGKLDNTPLKPEDFDFFLTYDDLEEIFDVESIVPVDSLPAFYEENNVATYVTDYALFIIEDDHLTYFQTLELEDSLVMTGNPDLKKQDEEEIWETYKNSELKMKIKYPTEWYLEDGNTVLSTYDTNYLLDDKELPEKRLKCDFFEYDNSDIEIDGKKQIINEVVSVYAGKARLVEDTEGPGLGDANIFIFRRDDYDTVALLCYSYDDYFYSTLLEMLSTFEFTDK